MTIKEKGSREDNFPSGRVIDQRYLLIDQDDQVKISILIADLWILVNRRILKADRLLGRITNYEL